MGTARVSGGHAFRAGGVGWGRAPTDVEGRVRVDGARPLDAHPRVGGPDPEEPPGPGGHQRRTQLPARRPQPPEPRDAAEGAGARALLAATRRAGQVGRRPRRDRVGVREPVRLVSRGGRFRLGGLVAGGFHRLGGGLDKVEIC